MIFNQPENPSITNLLELAEPHHSTTNMMIGGLFAKEGAQIPPRNKVQIKREKVDFLAKNTITAMDHEFDNNRDRFLEPLDNDDSTKFTRALNNIQITIKDIPVAVGTMMDVINTTIVEDKEAYPEECIPVIFGTVVHLSQTVIPTMKDIEPKGSNATLEEAYKLREVTNKGFARWLFDLSYAHTAPEIGLETYEKIRDRYEAVGLATSIGDDVYDIFDDIKEDRISLAVAAARSTGEYDALLQQTQLQQAQDENMRVSELEKGGSSKEKKTIYKQVFSSTCT